VILSELTPEQERFDLSALCRALVSPPRQPPRPAPLTKPFALLLDPALGAPVPHLLHIPCIHGNQVPALLELHRRALAQLLVGLQEAVLAVLVPDDLAGRFADQDLRALAD